MPTIVWDIDVNVFEKNLVVLSACNIRIPGIPGLGVIIDRETVFLICTSLGRGIYPYITSVKTFPLKC